MSGGRLCKIERWVEVWGDAERTGLAFGYPFFQTRRMIRMTAKSQDLAVILQTDRASLLRINKIREGLLQIEQL